MIKIKVENPDDLMLTLTVTMTLGEWKRIREDLRAGQEVNKDHYIPTGQLIQGIYKAVKKVEQEFGGSEI